MFTNRKTRRTSACYGRLFINKIRLLFFNRKPYTKCETKHRKRHPNAVTAGYTPERHPDGTYNTQYKDSL